MSKSTSSKDLPAKVAGAPIGASDSNGTIEASWDSTSLASFDLEDVPATATPQQKLVGGRFLIESQLPSGGMSILYLAHDIQHNRKVVIKHLNPRFSAKESYIAKELQALQKLEHKGVIKVWEVRRLRISGEDSPLCLIMEYAEGPTLKGCQPEQQVHLAGHCDWLIPVMEHLLDAVAHIHSRGVIHRDLKPENIIVTAPDQVKLIDFGLAADAEEVRSRERGCGTYFYTAPEVLGGQETTPRSDVYSLGMILYELLTGIRTTGNLTSPSDWWKEEEKGPRPFPKALDDVVMKAMAAQPSKRFADAQEMADAFQLAFAVGPWETRQAPVSALVSPSQQAEKKRASIRAAWIGLLLLVVLIGALVQQPDAPDGKEPPSRRAVLAPLDRDRTAPPRAVPRRVTRPVRPVPRGVCKAFWLQLARVSPETTEAILEARSFLWAEGVKTRTLTKGSLLKDATDDDERWLLAGPFASLQAAKAQRAVLRNKLRKARIDGLTTTPKVVSQTRWQKPWPICQ